MRLPFWLCGLTSLTIALLVAHEPFFWDTIQLGARHADWFYQQNFGTLLLPDDMDSGHIPAFGWYIAACWKLFGQSLLVSHLAMAPWIWLVLWQSWQLAQKVKIPLGKWGVILPFLVLVLDATLMAQLSLISPDIILMGAFLLGVNTGLPPRSSLPSEEDVMSVQDKNERTKPSPFLIISIILLGLISLRGMMVAIGLFTWQLFLVYQKGNLSLREIGQTLLPYLPGGILAVLYLGYHYYAKGWVGTHDDSPWAASFASTGGFSLVKQTAIVGWRMVDFGRIFLFIGLFLAWWRSGWAWSKEIRSALTWVLIMGVILALPAIVSPGLAQHRYLLPVYVSLAWLLLNVLQKVNTVAWRKGIVLLVIIGQITGHLWMYPDTIAQGWDASLAHKPYFEARADGLNFLQENNIPLSQVGTVFPEIGPLHWRDLNGEQKSITPLNFATNTYIWYSNINNDFSDEQVLALREKWTPVFSFRKMGVHLTIYSKK